VSSRTKDPIFCRHTSFDTSCVEGHITVAKMLDELVQFPFENNLDKESSNDMIQGNTLNNFLSFTNKDLTRCEAMKYS
jgi:hypothetical protein